MRLPFFGSKQPSGPIRLPLPPTTENFVLVYFVSRTPQPPDTESLKGVVAAWLDTHSEPPLRDAIKGFLERGFLSLEVMPRGATPELPLDLMRYSSRGEMEERTIHEATHVVLVRSMDVCMPVRVGYWGAVAAGRALARASGGTLVDMGVPRWLERKTYENRIPASGAINIWDEIIVPQSTDKRGHLWITTSGMKKWSLPELQIKDAPPNLGQSLLPVINGVAHLLMERLANLNGTGEKPPDTLTLPPELRLDLAAIERSRHVEPTEPPAGARGWTMIGLEYEPHRDRDSFLTLRPPSGFRGGHGVWLNSLLSDLLGREDTLRQVDRDGESMEAAHLQAIGELPEMRRRFQAGLKPGEHLFVKHGFVVRSDDHEYMWLSVNTWQGDRLQCQLANDPHYRKDLRAGQTVELTEDQIFDWMLMRPDGSQYGGWTNRVVERDGKR